MDRELLTARQSANRLGVSTATLYGWLSASNAGKLVIRGQPTTIAYLQGGPAGQGRILIEAGELERLMGLMRVWPRQPHPRRPPTKQPLQFPGITVPLGRPPK